MPYSDYLKNYSGINSKMSPGWHSKTLQIASSVLNRTAFALPVFNIERFESVRSTFSESSFNDIFRFAIITSRFTIIGIIYMVNSLSFCSSIPFAKSCEMKYKMPAKNKKASPRPICSIKLGS